MPEYKSINQIPVFSRTADFAKEVRDKVAIPFRNNLIEIRDSIIKEKERLIAKASEQAKNRKP